MQNYLEKIVENQTYENLGLWQMPELSKFSETKELFEYQVKALRAITKVLNIYFGQNEIINSLSYLYSQKNFFTTALEIKKYETAKDKLSGKINKRFVFYQENKYRTPDNSDNEYIIGEQFINRACFWMATGSGKSLVLIKTIELFDYLQNNSLIPKREIMLLVPREDLINQMKREIVGFNKNRKRRIDLISLKDYEDDKQSFHYEDIIKIYYYRSDLIRDERKENILDYKSYTNNGEWYIFLDEAHRGSKDDSKMQDIVNVLSKKGFLFNFSATFTDSLDYITTCYNFNLEKFINAGYGKNLYISDSYFKFTKDKDDFSEHEKQKQVLKSLIVFTLIKTSKKDSNYHFPLLITLVNSINTEESDLMLFFKKLEEIASGNLDINLYNETINEVVKEFTRNKKFVFGDETLNIEGYLIEKLTIKDIFENVFNAKTQGKIEIIEREKAKGKLV